MFRTRRQAGSRPAAGMGKSHARSHESTRGVIRKRRGSALPDDKEIDMSGFCVYGMTEALAKSLAANKRPPQEARWFGLYARGS